MLELSQTVKCFGCSIFRPYSGQFMEKSCSINNEISRMRGIRGMIMFILALLAHRLKLGRFLLRLRPYGSKTNVFALLLLRCDILGVSAAVSGVYKTNFIMILFSILGQGFFRPHQLIQNPSSLFHDDHPKHQPLSKKKVSKRAATF